MLYIYSLIGKPKIYAHISGDRNQILDALRDELGKIRFHAYADKQGQWWVTFSKTHHQASAEALRRSSPHQGVQQPTDVREKLSKGRRAWL